MHVRQGRYLRLRLREPPAGHEGARDRRGAAGHADAHGDRRPDTAAGRGHADADADPAGHAAADRTRGAAGRRPARHAGARARRGQAGRLAGLEVTLKRGRVRVGRSSRTVAAGVVTFSVPLNATGRRTLRRRGRLDVTVSVALTPPGGSKLTRSQRVRLRD